MTGGGNIGALWGSYRVTTTPLRWPKRANEIRENAVASLLTAEELLSQELRLAYQRKDAEGIYRLSEARAKVIQSKYELEIAKYIGRN